MGYSMPTMGGNEQPIPLNELVLFRWIEEFDFALALDNRDPFVLFLVIPFAQRRCMSS